MRAYEEGSTMAIVAPSGGPLKTAGLQPEKPRGPGVRALWGQQWTRLPKELRANGRRARKGSHADGLHEQAGDTSVSRSGARRA